jgi:hypothetical protein
VEGLILEKVKIGLREEEAYRTFEKALKLMIERKED